MSTVTDPTEILTKMAESLGLSAADLAAVAESLTAGSAAPTVADFEPHAVEACPPKSLPTYGVHFRRLVDALGERRLNEVTEADLDSLRDAIIERAAKDKIAKAIKAGRPLRTYETDAHGYGAGENFVRAARFFFKEAKRQRLIRDNPAADVKVPKRRPAPERPLLAEELEEVAVIWCTTGNDPELDSLLFEFHRKTAARREGGLNLRLGALDRRRGAVTLTEKFGNTRETPLDVDFIDRLEAFARSRGATGHACHVFRSIRHTPLTRKRYETIYNRIDAHTSWSEPLDVGVHWIRHTTLDDVRAVADSRVASSYAGHSDEDGNTINRYNKVTFEERAEAFEAIFGPRFN